VREPAFRLHDCWLSPNSKVQYLLLYTLQAISTCHYSFPNRAHRLTRRSHGIELIPLNSS
jgi:hypothetical protein